MTVPPLLDTVLPPVNVASAPSDAPSPTDNVKLPALAPVEAPEATFILPVAAPPATVASPDNISTLPVAAALEVAD